MERKIKVNASSAYKYKQVPTLMLKGDYLNAFGFPIDTRVSVKLEPERIIITPVKQESNQ